MTKKVSSWRGLSAGAGVIALIGTGCAAQARASEPPPPASEIESLRQLIQDQSARLEADEKLIRDQAQMLSSQKTLLTGQQHSIDRLLETQELGLVRGAGADVSRSGDALPAVVADDKDKPSPPGTVQPVGTVGEAPSAPEPLRQVALPEFINVLTPPGHLTLDGSMSYEQTSSNRLVYRGVEIVPGIQLGLVEASSANRNTAIATGIVRYGLAPRFEIEALAPYVYRSDRVEQLSQRDQTITQAQQQRGNGIGDIELTGRYQLTGGVNGWPIIISNLRFKTDTGKSPFEVKYDQFGVATDLALGSGFYGLEPSVSVIYTSDPVVLFGNLSYLYNFSRDINRTINGALVGEVNPGDSIGASAGFAFSVNPNFSFTLGYKHNYIYHTVTELGGVPQKSTSLQIGALLFGWSYRFGSRFTVVSNVEVGATTDAPNIVLTFRVPYTF